MTNRTKSEFTSHCRIAAKTNFLMLFPARFAHARYSSRMIDRFLNWGDHGKPKSGKIKGRCQPPLPLLHDYVVKMPSFTFFGGRKTSDNKLFLSLFKLECNLKEINSKEIGYSIQRIEINATKLEKTPMHFKSDVFAAVTLLMPKVPSFNRCVGFVLNMSKKWQRNLHSLFTSKDLSRSLLTSQVEASSER